MPWVYWFWRQGNITREGITADLEAMQRVDIGGVLIMETWGGIRLGLFNPSWALSGGRSSSTPQPQAKMKYYRDIAVLAFPTPGDYRIKNVSRILLYGGDPVGTTDQKELPAEMRIDRGQVTDLTARMDAQGRLVWDAPAGRWTVMRFGHTSTSTGGGRWGLECDKLSKEGLEASFNSMMARLIADVGPAAGKALVATHVDSWEVGDQNWTTRMREEFKTRRGYDLFPYLPVMTGRIVGSPEISARFLWDMRRTVSELLAENYAGHLRELARKGGLRFSCEAYGGFGDNLLYAGHCDEPMGEFGWELATENHGVGSWSCRIMAQASHL